MNIFNNKILIYYSRREGIRAGGGGRLARAGIWGRPGSPTPADMFRLVTARIICETKQIVACSSG
jgi:hypothetical protein